MNASLNQIPFRAEKPRTEGITMVMDKGMALRQAEDFLENATPYVDFIKLGWCTALFTKKLHEKVMLYKEAGLKPYFGGTLLETFLIRNQLDDYLRFVESYGIEVIEVSDGSVDIAHTKKIELIQRLSKNFLVLSEVGSKDANKVMAPYRWVESIEAELNAGSWKVITEARESGTVGMFRASGEIREGLVEEIMHRISKDKIIFEAPKKEQQVWFIKAFGQNVNLGNVAPDELIGLETLRMGLRGDTFHLFLNK